MKTLFRKAQILTMGGPHGEEPFEGDFLIEDDRISAVGADLGEIREATVVDGRNRLIMLGLVDAHLHSSSSSRVAMSGWRSRSGSCTPTRCSWVLRSRRTEVDVVGLSC